MFKLIFYCFILFLLGCTCREAEFSYTKGIFSSSDHSIEKFELAVFSDKKVIRRHVFKLRKDVESDSFYFFKKNDNYIETTFEMGKPVNISFRIEPNKKYDLSMDRGSDCDDLNVYFQTDSLMKISPWKKYE